MCGSALWAPCAYSSLVEGGAQMAPQQEIVLAPCVRAGGRARVPGPPRPENHLLGLQEPSAALSVRRLPHTQVQEPRALRPRPWAFGAASTRLGPRERRPESRREEVRGTGERGRRAASVPAAQIAVRICSCPGGADSAHRSPVWLLPAPSSLELPSSRAPWHPHTASLSSLRLLKDSTQNKHGLPRPPPAARPRRDARVCVSEHLARPRARAN